MSTQRFYRGPELFIGRARETLVIAALAGALSGCLFADPGLPDLDDGDPPPSDPIPCAGSLTGDVTGSYGVCEVSGYPELDGVYAADMGTPQHLPAGVVDLKFGFTVTSPLEERTYTVDDVLTAAGGLTLTNTAYLILKSEESPDRFGDLSVTLEQVLDQDELTGMIEIHGRVQARYQQVEPPGTDGFVVLEGTF